MKCILPAALLFAHCSQSSKPLSIPGRNVSITSTDSSIPDKIIPTQGPLPENEQVPSYVALAPTVLANAPIQNRPRNLVSPGDPPPDPGENGGPGVLGTDVNGNNVRDDVELWVIKRPETDAVKAAMVKVAAHMQRILLVAEDAKTVRPLMDVLARATACVRETVYEEMKTDFPTAYQANAELMEKIVNTDERKESYLKANSSVEAGGFQWFEVLEFPCREG